MSTAIEYVTRIEDQEKEIEEQKDMIQRRDEKIVDLQHNIDCALRNQIDQQQKDIHMLHHIICLCSSTKIQEAL